MNSRYTLILSLALNLALGIALLRMPERSETPVSLEQPASAAAPSSPPKHTTTTFSPATPPAAPRSSLFPWGRIESTDYRQYILNLKAVGCPERTIRDILVSDLDSLYARKAGANRNYLPPWKRTSSQVDRSDPQSPEAVALRAEKRAVVFELLGYESDNHDSELWEQNILANLTP